MTTPAIWREEPGSRLWEDVGAGSGSWYLDPLVADQKRRLNSALIPQDTAQVPIALKTDSFEEAFGADSPLADLLPFARQWLVMDRATVTAQRAKANFRGSGATFLVTDIRHLSVRSASLDLVFSNSTLDHFERREDFVAALREVGRVIRPGGRLILTLDNPLNPLYWPLRWLCSTRLSPFPLGYTASPSRLRSDLEAAGFRIESTVYLIHNPRLISTAIFMGLRRLLGDRADGPIRRLLACFQWLDRLPTRRFTSCYHGVVAIQS